VSFLKNGIIKIIYYKLAGYKLKPPNFDFYPLIVKKIIESRQDGKKKT